MSKGFKFEVVTPTGRTIGALYHAEDAAMLVAAYGDGARIESAGIIVWQEGTEGVPAVDSYDNVSEVIALRLRGVPGANGITLSRRH